MNEKHDIVGDIHGHAAKLERLLQRFGYEKRDGIYRHASRQVIFVGDFIDRGPEIRRTLQIARGMIDAGTARAVMENYELNALLYHTKGPEGEWLRAHNEKNTTQHQATLDQIALSDPAEWKLAGLDVGAAALAGSWPLPRCARRMGRRERSHIGNPGYTDKEKPCRGWRRHTREGKAADFLLKGPEYKLGDGTHFVDKHGFQRTSVRAKWWIPIRPGMTHAEAAMPAGEIRGEGCVPDGVSFPGYGEKEPALFFGHYWLDPKNAKAPLAPNIVCLDYSAGNGGPLVAYRFDGEAILKPDKLVAVE